MKQKCVQLNCRGGLLLLLLWWIGGIHESCFAQGEDNHWHFGSGQHLNFNSTPPLHTANSGIYSLESSASISDANGTQLFYTVGCRIWDRNGNDMPNAFDLLGNGTAFMPNQGSADDGVQIVPHPGNPDLYYVFSSSSSENGLDTVFYHIVDMRLHGGLGDVTAKNMVLLDAGFGGLKEFVTAAYGACGTFWFIVVTSSTHNSAFYAYKIDEQGLTPTPVISTPGSIGTASALLSGQLRVQERGAAAFKTTDQGILRADFNKTTGQLSNFQIIPNTGGARYLEFAPNEQFLYVVNNLGQMIQYNIQLYPDLTAISMSGIILNPNSNVTVRHRLGPDGKIYGMGGSSGPVGSSISRVEQPDLAGLASTYTPQYMTVPLTNAVASFGAQTLVRPLRDTMTHTDTVYMPCSGSSTATLLSHPRPDVGAYYWFDGTVSSTYMVHQEGIYWRYGYSEDCILYVDSFVVWAPPPAPDLGNDTNVCENHFPMELNVYHPRYSRYRWSDGSTGSVLHIDTPGTYYVLVEAGPCYFADTITIGAITRASLQITQDDTTICTGSAIRLDAVSTVRSTIQWNTGQTGASIVADKAGMYQAYTKNICGVQSDSIYIETMSCNCQPVIPNAFTPNGDGRNDVFTPVINPDCIARYYELKIYNRYGQLIFISTRPGIGWDGTYANHYPADGGAYFYSLIVRDRYDQASSQLYKGTISLIR